MFIPGLESLRTAAAAWLRLEGGSQPALGEPSSDGAARWREVVWRRGSCPAVQNLLIQPLDVLLPP